MHGSIILMTYIYRLEQQSKFFVIFNLLECDDKNTTGKTNLTSFMPQHNICDLLLSFFKIVQKFETCRQNLDR